MLLPRPVLALWLLALTPPTAWSFVVHRRSGVHRALAPRPLAARLFAGSRAVQPHGASRTATQMKLKRMAGPFDELLSLPIGPIVSTVGFVVLLTKPLLLFNLVFVLPLALVAGLVAWTQIAFKTDACPVCQADVPGPRDGTDFVCLSCGAALRNEDGAWARSSSVDMGGGQDFDLGSLFGFGGPTSSSFFDGLSGESEQTSAAQSRGPDKVIDVDVEVIDDK